MRISITVSRFRPDDVEQLRNKMQAVIRALLSFQRKPRLLDQSRLEQDRVVSTDTPGFDKPDSSGGAAPQSPKNTHLAGEASDDVIHNVIRPLRAPIKDLMLCITDGLQRCDASLMSISGHRRYLGPPKTVSSDVGPAQIRTRHAVSAFDAVESTILHSDSTPVSSIRDPDVVQLLVFARHVRETTATVSSLMDQVSLMQRVPDWPRAYLPSYPIWKAIHRTNAQVRHDRGGVTVGYYQKSFVDIARLLDKIKSLDYKPMSRDHRELNQQGHQTETNRPTMDANADSAPASKKRRLRYKIWRGLYRLQGFECRYAFKVCLVTSLLSIPSYLPQSVGWWDQYEVWWVVVVSWAVMHPQVGGNVQDLITRSGVAILGAVWSGIGFAAGNGSPYIMGVFAALYMGPMLYRYAMSSHPVSALSLSLSLSLHARQTVSLGSMSLTEACKAVRPGGLPILHCNLPQSASTRWRVIIPSTLSRIDRARFLHWYSCANHCQLDPLALCGPA
jgi:hypothetical protein